MTWHPCPLGGRLSRFARDGSLVLAWERDALGFEHALYAVALKTDRDAAALERAMAADGFPGGVLWRFTRLAGLEAVRLA